MIRIALVTNPVDSVGAHPTLMHTIAGLTMRRMSRLILLDECRRASVLDARNRGTRSVPQAVRAKRVRPLHFIHIRVCGYVHNHSRGRSGLTHTFIEPEIQKRAHETRMRTYAKPVTFFGIQNVRMKNACAPTGDL